MEIYVVQPGDTIEMIAARFEVSVISLIQYNELDSPYNLVPGQTIVIAHPRLTYTVREGDTLSDISIIFGVSIVQLLRNNPFLTQRDQLFSGETLVISYNTEGEITTNGFAYPYINQETLIKTLPSLTYLNIFNYRATAQGEISSYYDDTDIINIAKEYGTAPIMMVTTLTTLGEPDLEAAYENLMNEIYQQNIVNNSIEIVRRKGFMGLNLVFTYVNNTNRPLYENLTRKFIARFQEEGYLFFITINLSQDYLESDISYSQIDYSGLSLTSESIMFTNLIWGINYGPPVPVTSISALQEFIEFAITIIAPERIVIGIPVLGYDWQIPYEAGRSEANSITVNSALSLAREVGAAIEFEQVSQTPYFMYNQYIVNVPILHLVRFVDARTIDALGNLISQYHLNGIGIWNIMTYYAQLWLVINSQYNIIKILPDQLD